MGGRRLGYFVSSFRKRHKDVSTVQAVSIQEFNRSALEKIVLPPLDTVTNRHLLRWMFGFLSPVKPLIVMSCAWLALWVGAEVMSARQAASGAPAPVSRFKVRAHGLAADRRGCPLLPQERSA